MTLDVHGPGTTPAGEAGPIMKLAIREFDAGSPSPTRTIRIPLAIFSLASALVPRRIREELAKEGFDLEGIQQAARGVRSAVTLVEVEDHQKSRRIVISLE